MQYDIHSHKNELDGHSMLNVIYPDKSEVISSIGIHPWYIPDSIDWIDFEARANASNNVAVGECGLDKLCASPFERQLDVFKKQIKIAERNHLPLIIHCVRAFEEVISLKRNTKKALPWIIHGFSKAKMLDRLIESDFYISFGAAICNERNTTLREACTKIPLNRVFLETDEQDKLNIASVYNAFCELRPEGRELVEVQIEMNIKEVFDKWKIG